MAQTVPLQTLMTGITTMMSQEPTHRGYRAGRFIHNLRHRSTPSSGLTPANVGGTLHNKTAHSQVTNRAVFMPVNLWRLASGTAMTVGVSAIRPYFSRASNAMRIVWPVDINRKIKQSIQVPDNYDESANTQSIKLIARSIAPATTSFMDAEVYVLKGGSAIGSDLNPATAALATNPSTPEELTLTLTYATLSKLDVLAINVFPQGNSGAQVELFAGWFEYTAEE